MILNDLNLGVGTLGQRFIDVKDRVCIITVQHELCFRKGGDTNHAVESAHKVCWEMSAVVSGPLVEAFV